MAYTLWLRIVYIASILEIGKYITFTSELFQLRGIILVKEKKGEIFIIFELIPKNQANKSS